MASEVRQPLQWRAHWPGEGQDSEATPPGSVKAGHPADHRSYEKEVKIGHYALGSQWKYVVRETRASWVISQAHRSSTAAS
ncbi:hypothetical protein, partial [Deinococcus aquaedulcis]|uniref:hypothetical protein n=1 Tax=Deinococcus aquaedulcis TaxID=2840455 RepID=UPI001C83F26B